MNESNEKGLLLQSPSITFLPTESIIPFFQEYSKKGFYFTPLEGKIPFLKDWNNRPMNLSGIYPYIEKGNNIGVLTGKISNIFIVDIDVKHPESLTQIDLWKKEHGDFNTYSVKTGSGGYHFYFQYDERIRGGIGFKKGIDILSDGRQAVLPPFFNTNGQYIIIENKPIEKAPDWLIQLIIESQKTYEKKDGDIPVTFSDSTSPYGRAVLENACNAIERAVEGERHNITLKNALNVYSFVSGGEINKEEADTRLENSIAILTKNDRSTYHDLSRAVSDAFLYSINNPKKAPAFNLGEDFWDIERYQLNQIGLSKRLEKFLSSTVAWVDKPLKLWAFYDGFRWIMDSDYMMIASCRALEAEMRKQLEEKEKKADAESDRLEILKDLGKQEDINRLRSTLSYLSTCKKFIHRLGDIKYWIEAFDWLKPAENTAYSIFDQQKNVINLKNGIYDLEKNKLLPHDKNYYLTHYIPHEYSISADCPRWKNFLNDIFLGDKDLIHYVQKVIGYSLSGITSERTIFILWGTGSNGKSTFLKVIKKLMGSYGNVVISDALMQRKNPNTHDLADLRGSRFVYATETDDGKKLNAALIKQLTGNDPVKTRFLYKEYFVYDPEFKAFLATNHKPEADSDDEALWKRIKLIPFLFKPKMDEIDLNLYDRLIEEIPGILSWAIEGFQMWKNEGLNEPEKIIQATEEYRNESDSLQYFLNEFFEKNTDGEVLRSTFFELYTSIFPENDGKKIGYKKRNEITERLERKKIFLKTTERGIFFTGIKQKQINEFEIEEVPNF